MPQGLAAFAFVDTDAVYRVGLEPEAPALPDGETIEQRRVVAGLPGLGGGPSGLLHQVGEVRGGGLVMYSRMLVLEARSIRHKIRAAT